MSANGISTLPTKELRQKAKLDLATVNRTNDGNPRFSYDITQLPTQYSGNAITDNANASGLQLGRPWIAGTTVVIPEPETLEEAIPETVLVELESWFDAADGTAFVPSNPVDGDTFTQWTDKSSFAHNANSIGGATSRASYQVNEQNTLNVVRFDGNDGLSINPYPSLASAPALTIFAVMKMTSVATKSSIFSTNAGATEFYYDPVSGKFVVEAAGGIGTSSVSNDALNFHIHTYAFNGIATTNADSLRYRYDKADIALTFSGSVGNTLGASDTTLYIGNNNGTNFYTGDIAEFLIFTKALTTVEMQNVENYLSTKWNT